ncbi:zincin-like metallopeptidase domain-containing protein [Phenylobacterium sp. LjRoot225]|uniref:ArdC family protein n=1 Tax=Phenylobacterium sp. LjRoot225 TaxID=3342285 RepID=UPI003ED0AC1C
MTKARTTSKTSKTSKAKRVAPAETERFDVHQHVTDKIIAALEAGTKPWEQPWRSLGGSLRPLRFNGEPYRGVNVLMLWVGAQERGFVSPYWMTFQQAIELGGCVRKGERGTKVVKAGQSVFGDKDGAGESDGGEDGPEVRRWLKAYTVFNVDQIDGLPERYQVKEAEPCPMLERIEAADRFFANIPAKIHHGGDRAFYRISTDEIHMPAFELFGDAEHQAATLAHELIHWTRHPSRLDRDFGRQRFGDEGYAKEECVAELGAAYVGALLGLRPSHVEDHASYIASWLKVLKDDKRFIFTAASHAQRAADLLESFQASGSQYHDMEEAA